MALGKEYLKKNKKSLPRALDLGPRQRLTPVAAVTHPAIFAEGRLFAEGLSLPRAPRAGPRQRPPLPSARNVALGKPTSPRQRGHLR